jgi:hypothetical protein
MGPTGFQPGRRWYASGPTSYELVDPQAESSIGVGPSQTEDGECWACGEDLQRQKPWYLLDIRPITEGQGHSGMFVVPLCLECNSLVKRLVERIRIARFRMQGTVSVNLPGKEHDT